MISITRNKINMSWKDRDYGDTGNPFDQWGDLHKPTDKINKDKKEISKTEIISLHEITKLENPLHIPTKLEYNPKFELKTDSILPELRLSNDIEARVDKAILEGLTPEAATRALTSILNRYKKK